jgi:hypothetical protein
MMVGKERGGFPVTLDYSNIGVPYESGWLDAHLLPWKLWASQWNGQTLCIAIVVKGIVRLYSG